MFYFVEKSSLGIAWYINGKLVPEIHVERGKTYTFIVEGGKYFITNFQTYSFLQFQYDIQLSNANSNFYSQNFLVTCDKLRFKFYDVFFEIIRYV